MVHSLLRCGLHGVVLLATLWALPALGDTIVLKSGRRIQAGAVEERGDRIYWETEEGRFSLPKRLIERIERSNAPLAARRLANKAAVAPPTFDDSIINEVVVNGRVNRDLVAKLELEASRGTLADKLRAAAAHAAIAQHLDAQNDLAGAIASAERALAFAPAHAPLLLYLADLYYSNRDYARALEVLERAERDRSLAFEVLRLRGLILYEQEKLEAAIAAWRQALRLRTDGEIPTWLERAEREAHVAAGYREAASGRFTLRYSSDAGTTSARLVREVMAALERDFDDLASQLNYLPREPIVVVLYAEGGFSRVTGVPPWVDAVHDGKIRVPTAGLSSLTPHLRNILRHELSHAFIQEKSRNRAPHWLHEGLGQWFEGTRSAAQPNLLRQVAAQGRLPLASIDSLILGSQFQEVAAGYILALVVVETLMDSGGLNGVNRLLEELGRGASLDAALRVAYRMDSAGLEQVVLESLRRRTGG